MPRADRFLRGEDAPALHGSYALNLRDGRRLRPVAFALLEEAVYLDRATLPADRRAPGWLSFSGGPGEIAEARLYFLCNPLTDVPMFLGQATLQSGRVLPCSGVRLGPIMADGPPSTALPPWLAQQLAALSRPPGPCFLWHSWEKHHLTSRMVNGLGLWTQSRRRSS
jgi:hypothetical protein